MPTRSERVKRVPVPCSLPPPLAERLSAESDARDFSTSVLIERALVAMFARYDQPIDKTPTGPGNAPRSTT